MEFLVKLEDKINPQTWCFNPVHKGEKIVFDDDTFQASCPFCGETQYLYRKNNAISKKGHFITYKPDGWTWGGLERKHFGIVKIDCTEEQAREWCEGIKVELAETATEQERKEAMINERPRKYKFDYEHYVPSKMNWKDLEKESKIFNLTDITLIKII